MNTNRTRVVKTGMAVLALTMSLGLAACGSDDSSTAADTTDETTSAAPAEETSPAEESSEAPMGAADQVFGPACDQVPADGDGSFDGMATAPVASAASANPLLSTLVTAVTKAGLVDTLNSAEGITVFAPVNDAFAAIPPKTLKAVLKDKPTLTKILTHHVIAGQLSPDQLAGDHETLAGDMLTVTGSGEDFKIGAENATVLCGNVPTANATVYIIDSVLMPKIDTQSARTGVPRGRTQRKDRVGERLTSQARARRGRRARAARRGRRAGRPAAAQRPRRRGGVRPAVRRHVTADLRAWPSGSCATRPRPRRSRRRRTSRCGGRPAGTTRPRAARSPG